MAGHGRTAHKIQDLLVICSVHTWDTRGGRGGEEEGEGRRRGRGGEGGGRGGEEGEGRGGGRGGEGRRKGRGGEEEERGGGKGGVMPVENNQNITLKTYNSISVDMSPFSTFETFDISNFNPKWLVMDVH